MSRSQEFLHGCRDILPLVLGAIPFGIIFGTLSIGAGLSFWQTLGMSALVFAGSAQLASLPLIVAHAPIWVVFATALVVNLRFVIFSALLAPHFTHVPWRQRLFYGYISGDLTVALFLQRFPTAVPVKGKLSYLKGLMFPNWCAWQTGDAEKGQTM